jgi:hypothetical protein
MPEAQHAAVLRSWQDMTVRKRYELIKWCIARLREPESTRSGSIEYGRALQLLYDMFAAFGWEGTGGQHSIEHSLAPDKRKLLWDLYQEWKGNEHA